MLRSPTHIRRETEKYTVLLLDDDSVFSYAVSRYLGNAGFDVISATDSLAALDEIDAPDRQIDCLVLDILMPAGMPHGLAVAMMARQRQGDIPIIFISANNAMEGFALDVNARYLRKPVDLDVLIDEINAQIVGRSR